MNPLLAELQRLWRQYRATGNVDELNEELATNPLLLATTETIECAVDWFFWEALREADWNLAEGLLKRGIELEPKDINDFGPLYDAIRDLGDRPDVIQWLLEHGASRDRRSINGWMPLHQAACFGRVNTVRKLLERGAPVDCGTEIDGDLTPLMEAAAAGKIKCVALLLEHGADASRTDTMCGGTAEVIARQSGHQQVAEFLSRWRQAQENRRRG